MKIFKNICLLESWMSNEWSIVLFKTEVFELVTNSPI
jgi:hypothetical protein